MSSATATVSAPAGQADATPSAPPAADAPANTEVPAPKAAEVAKPPASILGDISEPVKGAEVKADGESGKAADGSKDGKSAPAELEIKLPDGVEVDATVFSEFRTIATKHGMTAEAASALVVWNHENALKFETARSEGWAKELQGDKEFGGEKLADTVLAAKKVVRAYGGEPAAAIFAQLGIGNQPELVKMLARVGRAMAEDKSSVGGGGKPPAGADPQAQLRAEYPSMFNEDGSPK